MKHRRDGLVRINVDAEVFCDEVLDQISDEILLEAIANRKLEDKLRARQQLSSPDALIEDAISALRAGDPAEALLILERTVYPKFKTLELCERAAAALSSQPEVGK